VRSFHFSPEEGLYVCAGSNSLSRDEDWVFASPQMLGRQRYWPDSALRKAIRPGAVHAGIVKQVGWQTFQHSFATLWKANSEDVKVVQKSLRHSNSRITLDVYKRNA
jgi:site-specific recombinase XerD